jgi:alcohol dehydrogenase
LADILSPIVPDLKGEKGEGEKAAKGIEKWLQSVGVPEKLTDEGFSEADVDKLVDLVFTTPSLDGLIGIAPAGKDKDTVRKIYQASLKPLQ